MMRKWPCVRLYGNIQPSTKLHTKIIRTSWQKMRCGRMFVPVFLAQLIVKCRMMNVAKCGTRYANPLGELFLFCVVYQLIL